VFKEEECGAGCVSLISSGTSTEESVLQDASSSGEDVFFLTISRLAAQETDEAVDVYDAHVCSRASPCPGSSTARSVSPCSEEASCREASSSPSVFGAPASWTFQGNGNVLGTRVVKRKALTRKQRLKRGVRACGKKPKGKRKGCEKTVRGKHSGLESRIKRKGG